MILALLVAAGLPLTGYASSEAQGPGSPALDANAASPSTAGEESVEPAGSQPIDLRSETLVVEHKKRRALFGGGVVATRGDLVLECPEVEALYDARSKVKTVRCLGPVTAHEGARTMRAARGLFDNETGLLTLEGEPTFLEGERRLVGETLEYDTGKGLVRLLHVEGSIPAEEAPDLPGKAGQGPLLVRAERVEHDLEGRRTSFDGGVVATRGNLTLNAPRLTATYDEEDRLERAVTSGGAITVRQGERRGRAQRAIFTEGARRLVLEGEPTVVDAGSSLSGDKVTFLLAQDRVVVDRPRAVFPLGEAVPGRKK